MGRGSGAFTWSTESRGMEVLECSAELQNELLKMLLTRETKAHKIQNVIQIRGTSFFRKQVFEKRSQDDWQTIHKTG